MDKRYLWPILIAPLLAFSDLKACMCETQMKAAFKGMKTSIVDNGIKPIIKSVEETDESVKKTNEVLEEEKKKLKEMIELEQSQLVQYQNLIFLLQREIEILKNQENQENLTEGNEL